MTFLEAIGLGVLQGLTEFLPISSSGHLALAQQIFRVEEASVLFDIVLHVGTLLAITYYYRRDWLSFWRDLRRPDGLCALHRPSSYKSNPALRFFMLIAIGSLPAGIFGLLFHKSLEAAFSSPLALGCAFLFTSLILVSTYFTRKRAQDGLTPKRALLIGLAQAVAIIPGISRSGSTLAAALGTRVNPDAGARFSFFLAYPTILGALMLKLSEASLHDINLTAYIAGFIASVLSGVLVLDVLMRLLRRGWLHGFAVWCLLMAMLSFSL